DRACVRVRRVAEATRAAAENLRAGEQLRVDFQPDDGLPGRHPIIIERPGAEGARQPAAGCPSGDDYGTDRTHSSSMDRVSSVWCPAVQSVSTTRTDLEALLLTCLAKKPADRPESARALRAGLLACMSAGEWTTERAAVWWREHRNDLRSGGRPA